MKDRKLATRYARALLAALPDLQRAQNADRFLAALREAMEGSPDFRDLLLDPAVSRARRTGILRDLARSGDQPPQVENFLATIVEHNRAASIPSIARVFHEELERRMNVVPAEIVSAAPLPEDLRTRAQRALERATGRSVRLETSVDPSLLGGAVTRVGSLVYDGSLRTQLDRLRRRMTQE
jgi:F-type H+-transporting ATPase subunit delta